MSYLSLYRKYRPQTFDEILGQEHVSQTLANAITEDRVAHAYLFTGPRGTGKTSTARILAKALNCEQGPTPNPCGKCVSCVAIADGSSLDVIEMDAASHSKVDDTREVLAGVPLATAGGRRKVYVIDEVHMLSTGSFNALLKTLEEPPPHVVFILATTEAHKVLQTIVSRTQRFDFRRVPVDVLETHLGNVAKSENVDIDPEAVDLIARHADGSARDALSALDQLSSFGGHVSIVDAENLLGHRGEDMLVSIFDAIAAGDVGGVFTHIQTFVAQGADMRQLALDALEHSRSLLLLRTAPDAEHLIDAQVEDRSTLGAQAAAFSAGHLLRVVDLLGTAIVEMRNAPNHRLLLEVALVRAAAPDTDPTAGGLLSRLERLERRLGIEGPAPAAAEPESQPARPAPKAARRAPSKARSKPAPSEKQAPPAQQSPAASSAPAPEKAPAPAAAPSHSPAAVGFGAVKDAWPAVMDEVKNAKRRVAALLSPSRPLSFEGDELVVEVQSDFHSETMSKDDHRAIFLEGLHSALGIRPNVSFLARGAQAPAQAAQSEEDIADLAEARTAGAADADPIELVKKGLGAEVVEEMNES